MYQLRVWLSVSAGLRRPITARQGWSSIPNPALCVCVCVCVCVRDTHLKVDVLLAGQVEGLLDHVLVLELGEGAGGVHHLPPWAGCLDPSPERENIPRHRFMLFIACIVHMHCSMHYLASTGSLNNMCSLINCMSNWIKRTKYKYLLTKYLLGVVNRSLEDNSILIS